MQLSPVLLHDYFFCKPLGSTGIFYLFSTVLLSDYFLSRPPGSTGDFFYLFLTVLLPNYLLCKPLGCTRSSELVGDGLVFGLHRGDILFVFQQFM